jgi:hypothetical protein
MQSHPQFAMQQVARETHMARLLMHMRRSTAVNPSTPRSLRVSGAKAARS